MNAGETLTVITDWLKCNPRSRASDIAEGTGLAVGKVSNSLNCLIRKGMVSREAYKGKGSCRYSLGNGNTFGRSYRLESFNYCLLQVRTNP